MTMGKGKHNEWHMTRVSKLYDDDYEPSNKVIRKRIKNKINKEIKAILSERK